jgi:DeoR/GlpR family transcriptional regulator of sugar metabolism
MSATTPQRRRAEIEVLMGDRAEVDIQSLAKHFGVSEMTIRRDLGVLEEDGVVRRLVGGRALLLDAKSREPALSTRANAAYDTKSHIGRAVADLLSDDEVVYIDGGSTALAAAHALRGSGRALTVLTRSLLVAAELAEEPNIEIFMLGGRVKSSEMLTTSSTMSDDLRHYNVDTYVMGISGVHPTRGLTDYDPDESAGKRLALERADRVVLVADHSKLGRVLMSRVAGVEDISVLVTDADADDEVLRSMPPSVTIVLVEPQP